MEDYKDSNMGIGNLFTNEDGWIAVAGISNANSMVDHKVTI